MIILLSWVIDDYQSIWILDYKVSIYGISSNRSKISTINRSEFSTFSQSEFSSTNRSELLTISRMILFDVAGVPERWVGVGQARDAMILRAGS